MKKYILLTLPFSLFFLFQTNLLAIAAEEGTLKWAFQTDGAFSGHPAIGFDGTIYLCDWNGNFYAINPDGTQKWAFQIGESYNASPAIGLDGTIYIGEHENNKLHAINPDGTQKWEFITDKPCNGNPAIGLDGTIYVGAGKTYAINPDGTQKWAFETRWNPTIAMYPAIGADGTIYVKSWEGVGFEEYPVFYAIYPDGTQKWVLETGYEVRSSPAIDSDGTIYVGGSDNRLHAINPDGTQKWAFKVEPYGNVDMSPTIAADGTIYVGAMSGVGPLYAINPDGTQKWAFETKLEPKRAMYPAIGADGTIYVKSWEEVGLKKYPVFYANNPDGTQKWVLKTGYEVRSSPAFGADGTIYVGGSDNRLHAINPDGMQKWAFKVEPYGNVDMFLTIAGDGTIYVGAMSGVGPLYAINPDGTPKWSSPMICTTSSPAIGLDGTIYVGSYDQNLYAINPDGTQKWSFETVERIYSSPVIATDGTIYVGAYSVPGTLYAINSSSSGLANSPWPMYGHDERHTGRATKSDKDLTYTPVTPCRIVDTRNAGGAISAGGIRSYNVRGNVASQGGNPAGCSSPKGEPRAVHVNVTSVPLGNGWITAYPYGSTPPTASIVNYRSDAQNVANSGTIKTCFNCGKDISIKSGGGTTHVIIDVLGYYYSKP